MSGSWLNRVRLCTALLVFCVASQAVDGQSRNPVLTSFFPPGAQTGATVEVTATGSDFDGMTALSSDCPGLTFRHIEGNRFAVTLAADAPTGYYDVRVVSPAGISTPSRFIVGTHAEQIEVEADNDTTPQTVALNSVVNGRIEKNGDVDQFRFDAISGGRLIVECHAERIDSRLRGVLELFDPAGRRVSTSRGYFGIDPLIDFRVPADGPYTVKIYDRTYTGSENHFYRLAIDTGPRVAFAYPSTITAGTTSRVALYGWNLSPKPPQLAAISQTNVAIGEFGVAGDATAKTGTAATEASSGSPALAPDGPFDRVEVDVTAPKIGERARTPLLLRSTQSSLDAFAWRLPGVDDPVCFCRTELPVVRDVVDNHTPSTAQVINVPIEVCGQLKAGDERDWYAFYAKSGEVFWFEAFGQRLDSPVDLALNVVDVDGKIELAAFHDEVKNLGGRRFPTNHSDPAGRWVAPVDGRYLVVVRNVIGGIDDDPRRCYRLSMRREEPRFDVVVLPGESESPSALNVPRGGRVVAEVVAIRHRGMTGPIRVTAENLPAGLDCPDIWLGPGTDRAPLVISALRDTAIANGALSLTAMSEQSGVTASASLRGGMMIGGDMPNGAGRLTSEVALAVAGESSLRITAAGDHEQYPQGSIVNVVVDVERPTGSAAAAVGLTGLLLPPNIENQVASIPADASRGYICFKLPHDLSPGRCTLAVRGTTTIPQAGNAASVVLYSNPVSFEVYPAPMALAVDLNAQRKLKRGEIMQLNYSARRQNGFIGKIHTDLFAPGGVVGIRGRGVTFVGQVETGVIQVIASEDAPLGPMKFLQLEAIGTVEDQPVYHANCFVDLEITE
jgi:hypothetical protein